MNKHFFLALIVLFMPSMGLTGCATTSNLTEVKPVAVVIPSANAETPPQAPTLVFEGSATEVWDKLQHTSTIRLREMQKNASNPIETGWIKLALISKRYSASTNKLSEALLLWQKNYPEHPAIALLSSSLDQLKTIKAPEHIAILLPQHGPYSSSGQRVKDGFIQAYYANVEKAPSQRIIFYDTSRATNLIALYQQAKEEGADLILGPLTKEEVQTLQLNQSFSIPTIALNYTDSQAKPLPNNFYEFGLLPEDEAIQIAKRAHEAGLSHALVIAPQNGWGRRLTSSFTNTWTSLGGSIQDTWLYASRSSFNAEVAKLLNVDPKIDKQLMKEDNNKLTLEQQRRHDFDVIFLFAQPQEARIIVPLLKFYYANNVPLYATSSIYAGKKNAANNQDLNGVIICDIPWKVQGNHAYQEGAQAERLYAVGQDAYLLSQTLTQLKVLPHFPLYGKTGALTLSANQQIHRRLPCTVIRNGIL